MSLSAEALYMAKTAYTAYVQTLITLGMDTPYDHDAFDQLLDAEKQAWEAAADAVRHVVMKALMTPARAEGGNA